jgi:molybdopterin-binding protein
MWPSSETGVAHPATIRPVTAVRPYATGNRRCQYERLYYGADMKLSARNQIPARVTGITQGEAIANVVLDAGGVRLVASITVEAVRDLGLKEGSEVTAVVKASDVMLVTSG